jgi:hypothetical protein
VVSIGRTILSFVGTRTGENDELMLGSKRWQYRMIFVV